MVASVGQCSASCPVPDDPSWSVQLNSMCLESFLAVFGCCLPPPEVTDFGPLPKVPGLHENANAQ